MPRLAILALLVLLTASSGAAVDLLIDTDMSIDVDDVGMLCAAHALADLGEARILAVVHDSGAEAGVGAISVINTYYGRGSIPIGAYSGPIGAPANASARWRGDPEEHWTHNGRGVYIDELVASYPTPIRSIRDVPPALNVYRQTLAAAEDHSVTIVSVGFATNLAELLRSSGDSASELDGAALLAQKVARVVFMGGRHHMQDFDPPEWNIAGCGGGCGHYDDLAAITAEVLARWPSEVPIELVGFEAGVGVHTGLPAGPSPTVRTSPCRVAYDLFCTRMEGWCEPCRDGACSTGVGRASWDPMALVYAVRGPQGHYSLERGQLVVDSETGANQWHPLPNGTQAYLVRTATRLAVSATIDELLLRPSLHAESGVTSSLSWYAPQSFGAAISIALVSTVCWGTWSNTAKAAKHVKFVLYYIDFAIGAWATATLAFATLGGLKTVRYTDDHDASSHDLYGPGMKVLAAFAAGGIFNVANVLLVAGIAVAGLAVAFPVGIGTALVLGTLLTHAIDSTGHSTGLLVAGLFAACIAILLQVAAYRRHARPTTSTPDDMEMLATPQAQDGDQPVADAQVGRARSARRQPGLLICASAGVLMAMWSPLSALSMAEAPDGSCDGCLTPYASSFVFACAILTTTPFICNFLMAHPLQNGDEATFAEYWNLKWSDHGWGALGGCVWAVGTIANLMSGSVIGQAISFGIGQAAPMVATLWGIGFWGEFIGARAQTRALIGGMALCYMAAITLIASSSSA
jgi:glucose uptake protein